MTTEDRPDQQASLPGMPAPADPVGDAIAAWRAARYRLVPEDQRGGRDAAAAPTRPADVTSRIRRPHRPRWAGVAHDEPQETPDAAPEPPPDPAAAV